MSVPISLPPPPALVGKAAALLLDFDGTLVELVDRPDAVVVDVDLITVLQNVRDTFDKRIALVSGRSIAQIDRLFGNALGDTAVVGSHGEEMRAGPIIVRPDRPDALLTAEAMLNEAFADHAGVVIEVKSLGVAVHYRMAPEVEATAREMIARIAADSGLAIQEGKMMLELRCGGHDKGSGIVALMAHPSFAGHHPIFVGDDVTDEAGFRAVASLGGFGVLVGAMRATSADYRLDNVPAVRAWLTAAS